MQAVHDAYVSFTYLRKWRLLTSFYVVRANLDSLLLSANLHHLSLLKAKRTLLWALALSIVFIVVTVAFFENRIRQSAEQQTFEALTESAQEVVGVVDANLRTYMDTLRFLHSSPAVQGVVDASLNDKADTQEGMSTEQWKRQVESMFAVFMENNREVDQLRIILADEKGSEFIRVEQVGKSIEIVAQTELQEKGNRDYYVESVSKNRNEFYISDINLNREYGKIEFPYKSVLRLSLPLFSENGERIGFIIANINAQILLTKMQEALFGAQQLIVTDADGFFIVHPDSNKVFSKDLNKEVKWSSEYRSPLSPGFATIQPLRNSDEAFYAVTQPFNLSPTSSLKPLNLHVLTYQHSVNGIISDKRIAVYSFVLIILSVLACILWFVYRSSKSSLALAKLRRESAAIVESSKDAIFSVDSKGKVKSWNMAAETMFCVPSQLVIGHHYSSCKPLASLGLEMAFAEAEAQTTFSAHFSDTSCDEKYLQITASKILNDEDILTGVAVVIRDVTDERHAKAAVEKINWELEEKVQRRTIDLVTATKEAKKASEIKSAFISNISHEMRTPLNGIVGSLSLLKRHSLNEKSMQLLSMMEVSCNSLSTLINDVLDLSKIEAGKLDINNQNFNPISLIESLARVFVVKAADKGLHLLVDTTALSDVTVYSDPHRISQILNNLLNNAIKFTESGHILLSAAICSGQGEEQELHFSVIDTGMGIAKENQSKLFTPFTQADSHVAVKYGGTGLGLSISKQLSQLMGGDISFRSTEDAGSAFSFFVTYPISHVNQDDHDNVKPQTNSECPHKKWAVSAPYKPLEENLYSLLLDAGAVVDIIDDKAGMDITLTCYDAILVDESSALLYSLDEIWKQAALNSQKDSMPEVYILQSIDAAQHKCTEVAPQYLHKPLFSSTLTSLSKAHHGETLTTIGSDVHRDDLGQHSNVKTLHGTDYCASKEPQTFDNANVIIVDDNLINREVAKGVLEGLPIKVFTCNDGEEVISFLQQCEEKQQQIHAILMDCQMPNMDGYEATRAIRDGEAGKTFIDVPIIAMTASAMLGEREKCLEVGMDDFTTKPVMAEVLIPKVKRWLAERMKRSGYHTDNVSPLVDKLINNINDEVQGLSGVIPKSRYWDKDNAIARIKGDKALFSRVCNMFANSAPDKVKLLEKAIAHKDAEQVKLLTLKLKGMSADIGAVQLQSDFESLWALAKAERWHDALEQVPAVEADLSLFLKIMDVA